MAEECWKPVVGYEGYYEISDQGRVRSLPRMCPAGPRAGQRSVKPRILTPTPHYRRGYLSVQLQGACNLRREIQVLVLEAFRGPRPPAHQARHLNGMPADNRLANLRWGTYSENNADMDVHGTRPRGSDKPGAKLCAAAVRLIRAQRAAGLSWRVLARQHKVSINAVRQIIAGETWSHV